MKRYDIEPVPHTPQGDAVIHEIAAMATRASVLYGRETVTPASIQAARQHAAIAGELDPTLKAACTSIVE